MATGSRTVMCITQWFVCFWWRAGYTARKFLYEARLLEETSTNRNAWQIEWGFQCVCGRTDCLKEMQSTAKCLFRRKWVGCFGLKKKNRWGFKNYRVPRNCYSYRAYVHNWVNWPERKSDHKTLYNVKITCGAITLSLYMTVRSI